MPKEEKTDLTFPKAKADLEEQISDLTSAVHSIHAALKDVKQLGGGNGKGWTEKVRWALTIIVIPLAIWAVNLHVRVSLIEASHETTHVEEQLTDHEQRLRSLERSR